MGCRIQPPDRVPCSSPPRLRLPHRLVVLTGPMASGKTTARDTLMSILDRLGHKTHLVDSLTDLYAPLAARMGMPLSAEMSRDEVTAVVAALYARYGRDVGTSLLLDYLAGHSVEPVYVVDSKRNPEGIRALRARVARLAVVGVYAPTATRLARLGRRARPMDVRSGEESLRREEEVFDVHAALAEADVVIENDVCLPFRTEMLVLQAVQDTHVIPRIGGPYVPLQPLHKAASPPGLPPLTRSEYRSALDEFAALAADHNLVVVQGGNRFAAHYLRSRHQVDVTDLKLSSLSKQHPSVLLATALTPLERIRTAGAQSCTVAELLTALPDPPLPFTRRTTSDRRVRGDFARLQARIGSPVALSPAEEAAREALCDTAIRRRLADDGRPVAFLDDIVYRGRTLHAAWYVLRILGLAERPWRLFPICADRASQHLSSPLVQVLRPGRGYPFENCARSAQGYYDLTAGRFEYRDLSALRPVLAALWPAVVDRDPLDTEWDRLLARAAAELSPPHGMAAVAAAVAAIAVHQRAFGGDARLDADALADQRAAGLGWCPPFLDLWDGFISQERPVRERERFKRRVRALCARADTAESAVFGDLTDLYRENHPRIWYRNDCLI